MTDLHGIILADRDSPELRELVTCRTSASLPFAGRYRLIDFALSSLRNAGVRDVGVVMQKDFQSLLDHVGSGKEWDMSRKRGGLRLLPPFGHSVDNATVMDALLSVESYIRDIKESTVVLARGNLAANIDLEAALRRHEEAGADVTVVCAENDADVSHHRFAVDDEGFVTGLRQRKNSPEAGYASLEMYIMPKTRLLEMMDYCGDAPGRKFHRDGLGGILENGGRIAVYVHPGYAAGIKTVEAYFAANMDMLKGEPRASLFPAERPVHTKERADVSSYYAEGSSVKSCLVADGCFIEGEIENCVLFRGVRIGRGAKLKNCVIMQDTVIGESAELTNVISDKDVEVSAEVTLAGSPRLPLVLPKGSKI